MIFLYNHYEVVYKVFIDLMEWFHSMIILKEKWLWNMLLNICLKKALVLILNHQCMLHFQLLIRQFHLLKIWKLHSKNPLNGFTLSLKLSNINFKFHLQLNLNVLQDIHKLDGMVPSNNQGDWDYMAIWDWIIQQISRRFISRWARIFQDKKRDS